MQKAQHQDACGDGARVTPGCAYPLDTPGSGAPRALCAAPCRPGSAYCATHHALCHLPAGSIAERLHLQKIEALATAVGGKRGRPAAQPPDRLLRRLARIEQTFFRPECS